MKHLITGALMTTLALSSTFAMETSGNIATTGSTEATGTIVTVTATTGTTVVTGSVVTTGTTTGTAITGTTLTGKALIEQLKATMKQEIKALQSGAKATIKATWGQFRSEYTWVNKYFKKKLTKEERAQIKEIFANNKAALDAMRDGMKNKTFTGDVLATRLASVDALYTALSVYVDPAKVDAYNKFVQAKKDAISKNFNTRKDMRAKAQEIRANYKEQMKALKPMKPAKNASGSDVK